MIDPPVSLTQLVGSSRARSALMLAGPLIAIVAVGFGLNTKIEENSADIRELREITLVVVRRGAEIEAIQNTIARMERTTESQHQQTIDALMAIEQEMRVFRSRVSGPQT